MIQCDIKPSQINPGTGDSGVKFKPILVLGDKAIPRVPGNKITIPLTVTNVFL